MPQFLYVYILRSLGDGHLYVDLTKDLRKRLTLHNSGAVPSTSPRRPFELIFYEAYRNEYDVRRRELYFKMSKGKTALQTMLREFLKRGNETLS